MAFEVVVRPIVDPSDLFETAQTFLLHLDVEVDLVVERALLFVELRESERVAWDSESLQVEPLHRGEVIDIPGREIAGDQIFRGNVMGAWLVFLRRPRNANRRGRDRVESQAVREGRGVEEDLEFRLEELPHAVCALSRADLVSVGPPDDREAQRKSPAKRLELPFEVQVHALSGLRPEVRAVFAARPDLEREHHVEGPRRTEFALTVRASDLQVADARVDLGGRQALVFFVSRGLEQLIPT